ncbi:hypothetical protein NKJ13_21080 [Mesorhizobium sp. M0174]|uniref:DUF5677 domain-containing protein n=1 Tax=Mesorhizobium sp. M0174 TaxID=2956904 RepID=UPI00333A1157
MSIRPAWRKWLAEFADASDRLQLTGISLAFSEEAQRKSVVLALYARIRSELATALVLVDAKRDLAFRGTCRGIIECALHLEMAETDPTYLNRLKDDDDASRRSRAIRFRTKNPTLAKEADKTLSDFIQRLTNQKNKLQVSELDSALPRLTHSYRELSADTVHVSLTSIQRHVVPDKKGIDRLRIEPKFDAYDLEDAASLMALSLLNATRILLVLVPEITSAVGFRALHKRYVSLYRQGIQKLKKAEAKASADGA